MFACGETDVHWRVIIIENTVLKNICFCVSLRFFTFLKVFILYDKENKYTFYTNNSPIM